MLHYTTSQAITRQYRLISRLVATVLVAGCIVDNSGGDTQSATTTTTSTSPTAANLSGSATSVPGSASDGTASDSAPTMATTTLAASGTSSSTGEECRFLSCNDIPPVDTCDPFEQNCPDGQKCNPYIPGGDDVYHVYKCVEVSGSDEPGDACTAEGDPSGVDSCIKGATCWGADMMSPGTCLAQCTGTARSPICAPMSFCSITGGGGLSLCFPTCDPLAQDCDSGDACYPFNYGFTCIPAMGPNVGQANDPCEYSNGCKQGLMCADASFVGMGCALDAIGCCTPFCKFPDGACPNPDQQCVQYFDPMRLPPGDPNLDIGSCGIPG
jgi:hypothetical protein